jgi:hypothetical protein
MTIRRLGMLLEGQIVGLALVHANSPGKMEQSQSFPYFSPDALSFPVGEVAATKVIGDESLLEEFRGKERGICVDGSYPSGEGFLHFSLDYHYIVLMNVSGSVDLPFDIGRRGFAEVFLQFLVVDETDDLFSIDVGDMKGVLEGEHRLQQLTAEEMALLYVAQDGGQL